MNPITDKKFLCNDAARASRAAYNTDPISRTNQTPRLASSLNLFDPRSPVRSVKFATELAKSLPHYRVVLEYTNHTLYAEATSDYYTACFSFLLVLLRSL